MAPRGRGASGRGKAARASPEAARPVFSADSAVCSPGTVRGGKLAHVIHNVQLASRSRQVQNRPSRQIAISSAGKRKGAVESGRGPMPTVTCGS